MSKIGVFPGSFDPLTKGHEAIIRKSLSVFDKIVVAVGVNSSKAYMFSLEKRMSHINELFKNDDQVEVQSFQKLTVDFCKDIGANHIVRGLRDSKDFQYEKPIAHMNFDLAGIDTVFFLTELKYNAISSSIIREIYKNNGSIEQFVTKPHLLV
ncbi:MAG: pantetheine-phosphate adenylyltransferase [Crocinitomicaceae bacterium]|nr:pantetheine-phosphate adenylyltransferase [Flavobacteriales bacterium]NQZ36946.1 pantetheine-phosphate adenylyltransferase [Crocinitomicaceae bacterium]PHR29593.1 MAG: pantetheine-phosphate adenylyltransferase [Fluviicola sp.]